MRKMKRKRETRESMLYLLTITFTQFHFTPVNRHVQNKKQTNKIEFNFLLLLLPLLSFFLSKLAIFWQWSPALSLLKFKQTKRKKFSLSFLFLQWQKPFSFFLNFKQIKKKTKKKGQASIRHDLTFHEKLLAQHHQKSCATN